MLGRGFELTFDEDQEDQYKTRNDFPDDLFEKGKLFEKQFEQVEKSSNCVPHQEIPLQELQTPGFGFLAITPFRQICSHLSDRTQFEINESSFYSETESVYKFIPRKKGLGQRRSRRVSDSLDSFEVYFRPNRKKNTAYSRTISPYLCTAAKYNTVIVYPNDVDTVEPKFFLNFKCQDTGKYDKSYDAVSVDPGNRRGLKRHFKSGTILIFVIQITKTSNMLKADDLRLCIEDEKTNLMFYRSDEFEVISRRDKGGEGKFWENLLDNDLVREEQRSLVDEEEEENNDGESSSDEEYVVKKPRKRRMRRVRKKKKRPEEVPKRRQNRKMSFPPKTRKTQKIGRKRKRGSEVHDEVQNRHFLPVPKPQDCDLPMPDFNLPEKDDHIDAMFPMDLQDKSVLPLPPPIGFLTTPPRRPNSRKDDISGYENIPSPVSLGNFDEFEDESEEELVAPQVAYEEVSQRKSRRGKKRKTYDQYAPEVPEKRKKDDDDDYVPDEMEEDEKDYL